MLSFDNKRKSLDLLAKRPQKWIQTDLTDDDNISDFESTPTDTKSTEEIKPTCLPINSKPSELTKPKSKKLVSQYFLPVNKKRKTPSPKKSPKKLKTNELLTKAEPLSFPIVSNAAFNDSLPEFLYGRDLLEKDVKWKEIHRRDLHLDYTVLFSAKQADEIFKRCEAEIEYYTGDLTKVKVFGKWHQIPRKQVAFGDPGLSYKFSGNTLPATPWHPLLRAIRDVLKTLTGNSFNFVLVNRYNDGNDHIGEHRDDEKDLEADYPIASLSFGQARDFVFRHSMARLKKDQKSGVDVPKPVTVVLEHGSLLMMKSPTNKHWYHSIPVRKNVLLPRINLTFRKMRV